MRNVETEVFESLTEGRTGDLGASLYAMLGTVSLLLALSSDTAPEILSEVT